MRWTAKLRLRIHTLFHRSEVEQDLTDELRDYLEHEVEQDIASGSSPEEARRRALASLRGAEWLKEECRDARGLRWLEDSFKDLHFALRSMRRAPAFAWTVIAVLALCIGANTAIFSVVDTVLFRPLPFAHQERLVLVTEGIPSLGFPVMPLACPDYLFIAAHNRSFESTGAFRTESYEISGAGQPRRVEGARMTASLFRVLQVAPTVERSFTGREDSESKAVVVLNYGFAQSIFGDPQHAIGHIVQLDRKPYTVIGVMPKGFTFPLRGMRFSSGPADLFVPVSWTQEDREETVSNFNYSMIARLRPNVTIPQAASDVHRSLKELETTYSPELRKIVAQIPNFSLQSQITLLREEVTREFQRPLLLLLAAVGLVLLIGCADVANLMFSRMVGREREFALRAALGAGSWRLTRQMITEGLVLSAAGGTAGFLLAFCTLPLLLYFAPDDLPRLHEIGLNWRVAVFLATITLAIPLLFCVAPLLGTIRAAIAQQLRNGGRANTSGKYQRLMMSAAVVVQFSLAFLLLTSTGLLIRSFIKASEANPGFRPQHVLNVRIALPGTIYSKPTQVAGFFNRLLAGLDTLPGVEETGAVSNLPMDFTSNNSLTAEGHTTRTRKAETIYCAGNALKTLGVSLLRGRLLQPRDDFAKQKVVVISETLAKRIWPQKDPIGKHLKFGADPKEPWMSVVGVVKDVRSSLASNAPRSMMFTTRADWVNSMNVLVRTSGDPLALSRAIRNQVHRLDPSLPAGKIETLDQVLDNSLSPERFRTLLLASFAGAALLLAMLGIAGLLAYNTAQRTTEFGVRIAMGADRRDLLFLVLKQSLRLSGTGIAIGLAVSILVTRALSSLLYDTSTYDARTFVCVPLLLAFVALVASALPAWRAARTDPITALKTE